MWVSPQQFKLIHTYKTGDYLCNKNINLVTVEKIYSWDQNFINNKYIEASLIAPTYLSLVAEAIDYPVTNLYSNGSDPNNTTVQYLLATELAKVENQPIKTDYLSCSPH